MKHRLTSLRSLFQAVFSAIVKVWPEARKPRRMAVLCLAVLTLGVVSWKADALTRAWARIGGSSTVGFLNWWLGQSVQAQGAAASGTPAFTTFDAPGAGTSMLQGTFGVSINTAGDIAGIFLTAPNVAHGFVRAATNGTITEFDAPNAGTGLNQGTFPFSINTAGDISGMYSDANTAYHGFVRIAATGTVTEFDVPGAPTTIGHRGTVPSHIDAAGDIVGGYKDLNDVHHGFLRVASGTFTTFDAPGAGTGLGQGTFPFSINTAGTITGNYKDASGVVHGFVRAANGTITAPIDAPGAGKFSGSGKDFSFDGTVPTSIDTAGDIVGLDSDPSGVFHGFVRTAGGTITTFDVPGAGTAGTSLLPGTLAISGNDSVVITGGYEDANGVAHGFMRAADGTITTFDAPGAGTTGKFPLHGTLGASINNSGVIAGGYSDANSAIHGFVLTPAVTLPPAATPTFSPPAGTYTSAQMVTISDTTLGATIHFTTNGQTPTTADTTFTTPIPVGSTKTIEAIAVANGFSQSAVATALYTINLPTPTFQLSASPSSLTIAAGASASATITATPAGGFTSTGIAVTCPTLPPGVHCANLSIPVPNANPATGQLMVSVDPAAAQNAMASVAPAERTLYAAGMLPSREGQGWWMLSAGTGLAAIILLLLPGKRRLRMALGLGLVCLLSFTLGCGSSGGGGTPPVATATHLTLTSATGKGASGATFSFTTAVTGGTPTGQIQLFDGATAIGTAVAVTNGTATLTTPALTVIGTHAISAHYLGTTNSLASQSGTLGVTITGPTMFAIQGSPAASNGSPAINITIN